MSERYQVVVRGLVPAPPRLRFSANYPWGLARRNTHHFSFVLDRTGAELLTTRLPLALTLNGSRELLTSYSHANECAPEQHQE